MHNAGRWKAVEVRAACRRVSPDVLSVHEFTELHVGKLLCQADCVERVTGRTKDGANLRGTLLEALHGILAVVENHSAERLIDAVVDVVTELALSESLADDLCDGGRRRGHQEASGLSEDFDWLRKQAVQFRVDRPSQRPECDNRVVVVSGESAADVQELELEPARPRLREN